MRFSHRNFSISSARSALIPTARSGLSVYATTDAFTQGAKYRIKTNSRKYEVPSLLYQHQPHLAASYPLIQLRLRRQRGGKKRRTVETNSIS